MPLFSWDEHTPYPTQAPLLSRWCHYLPFPPLPAFVVPSLPHWLWQPVLGCFFPRDTLLTPLGLWRWIPGHSLTWVLSSSCSALHVALPPHQTPSYSPPVQEDTCLIPLGLQYSLLSCSFMWTLFSICFAAILHAVLHLHVGTLHTVPLTNPLGMLFSPHSDCDNSCLATHLWGSSWSWGVTWSLTPPTRWVPPLPPVLTFPQPSVARNPIPWL